MVQSLSLLKTPLAGSIVRAPAPTPHDITKRFTDHMFMKDWISMHHHELDQVMDETSVKCRWS